MGSRPSACLPGAQEAQDSGQRPERKGKAALEARQRHQGRQRSMRDGGPVRDGGLLTGL